MTLPSADRGGEGHGWTSGDLVWPPGGLGDGDGEKAQSGMCTAAIQGHCESSPALPLHSTVSGTDCRLPLTGPASLRHRPLIYTHVEHK